MISINLASLMGLLLMWWIPSMVGGKDFRNVNNSNMCIAEISEVVINGVVVEGVVWQIDVFILLLVGYSVFIVGINSVYVGNA